MRYPPLKYLHPDDFLSKTKLAKMEVLATEHLMLTLMRETRIA